MTNQNKIGIALLAGAVIWYGALRGVDAVKVVFNRITLASMDATKATFRLFISITNPLFISIPINYIVGDVYLADKKCGEINTNLQQKLHAKKTSNIYVDFNVGYMNFSKALWANIQSGDIDGLKLRVIGKVNIKGVNIPFDREFDVLDNNLL